MKIQLDKPFYCIGTISKEIATAAHIEQAAIFITRDVLVHINDRHHAELNKMGTNPTDFINYILHNYTEIRRGSGESLLLVVPERPAKAAAIGLEIRLNGLYGFWLVKSAFPIYDKRLSKYEIVYKKKSPTRKGR